VRVDAKPAEDGSVAQDRPFRHRRLHVAHLCCHARCPAYAVEFRARLLADHRRRVFVGTFRTHRGSPYPMRKRSTGWAQSSALPMQQLKPLGSI
jgi:hypothetical protein